MNPSAKHKPFIFATVSGKGGVGKSLASVNIAETLRLLGYRTAILDVDAGMANVATMFNVYPPYSVTDWMEDKCRLTDVMVDADGITLVTTANEPGPLTDRHDLLIQALDQVLDALAATHDFVVIDTPAGLGELNLWALDRSRLGAIMLVDEPTSVSDVYRFCKYVLGIDPTYPFAVIVNMAESDEAAAQVHEKFNTIVKYFLQTEIPSMGYIPLSNTIRDSIRKQTPVMRMDPEEELEREFSFIAQNIIALAREMQRRDLQRSNVK
ncbi:MAG: flagellar biosynthesis protein FlhG [Bacteroidetes bacterium HLUCCA01]|nr:MAG: flagellar biosynthesis protein FlhG [Bacteroidetes bacterium HLUCCA01]